MTALALAGKCGGLGASGSRADSPASAASCASASEPRAPTERPRNARRVALRSNTVTASSLDVQKRISGQQHLTQIGPGPAVGLFFLGIDRALSGQEFLARGALVHARSAPTGHGERQVKSLARIVARLSRQPAGETLRPAANEFGIEQSERLQGDGRGRALAARGHDRRGIEEREERDDLRSPLLQINRPPARALLVLRDLNDSFRRAFAGDVRPA